MRSLIINRVTDRSLGASVPKHESGAATDFMFETVSAEARHHPWMEHEYRLAEISA